MSGDYLPPRTLAHLVARSEAIVLGRYIEIEFVGTEVAMTPVPNSTPPDLEISLRVSHVTFHVDQVLKTDGVISADSDIPVRRYGKFPTSSSDIATDAASGFRMIWPEDTEFILFMDRMPNSDYEVISDHCGWQLVDGNKVTCTNGSVLPFFDGVDGDEAIELIEEEVGSPSPTETALPTSSPLPPLPTDTP
jgi:hypothetical protein